MAQRLRHLERLFPGLVGSDYSKTSEVDPQYNCFAFAVHDTRQYWQKIAVRGYYWPLERDDRIQDWVRALELNNFKETDNWDLEAGFEKGSIYVLDGSPEHVARQLEDGKWVSKIGSYEDIMHASLEALKGGEYGEPRIVMKRKRPIRSGSST
jgi:hypothetical protein